MHRFGVKTGPSSLQFLGVWWASPAGGRWGARYLRLVLINARKRQAGRGGTGPGSPVRHPHPLAHKQLIGWSLRVTISRSARRKLACEQRRLFPVGTTQEPCGVDGLREGPGELGETVQRGESPSWGWGWHAAGGMVCNRVVPALHCAAPCLSTRGTCAG